ncbi:MAG: hypothetical protein R3E31_23530 [Chloroflexota bacterium]
MPGTPTTAVRRDRRRGHHLVCAPFTQQPLYVFQGNPQTARLLSWLQIIEDPTGMETGQEIGRQMLDKIRRAQASGQIRDDIEPENVLAISIALTTHWFQSRHVIENLTGSTHSTGKRPIPNTWQQCSKSSQQVYKHNRGNQLVLKKHISF